MCFQLLSSRVASNHAICRLFEWRKRVLRCLEASKWHKATVLTRASAPSCHKTLYIGMSSSYVRFKVAAKNTVNTINTSVSRVTPDSLQPFVHPVLSQFFLWGRLFKRYSGLYISPDWWNNTIKSRRGGALGIQYKKERIWKWKAKP